VDKLGVRHAPGEIVIDRDGHEWTVQAYYPADKNHPHVRYDVTPVKLPEFGDIGYVMRRVTDERIDARDFGFKPGHVLKMVDGNLVQQPSQYT
jgi:hypothetical protein